MNLPELRKDIHSLPARDHAVAHWLLGFSTGILFATGASLSFSVLPFTGIAAVVLVVICALLVALSWWMVPPPGEDIRETVTRLTEKDHDEETVGQLVDRVANRSIVFDELGRQPCHPVLKVGLEPAPELPEDGIFQYYEDDFGGKWRHELCSGRWYARDPGHGEWTLQSNHPAVLKRLFRQPSSPATEKP